MVPCLQEDDLQLRAIGELYDLVRTDKAHVEDALSMGLPITILPLLLSEKFVSASPLAALTTPSALSCFSRGHRHRASSGIDTVFTATPHTARDTHTVRHCSKRACD